MAKESKQLIKSSNTKLVVEGIIRDYLVGVKNTSKTKTHKFYYIPVLKITIKLSNKRTIEDWISQYVNDRYQTGFYKSRSIDI